MNSLLASVVLTFLAFGTVLTARWYHSPRRDQGFGAIQYLIEWSSLMTLVFLLLAFGTLWLFYIKDGIEGAEMAWNIGGPIVGAATGYWCGKPQQR
ncbi:MAG: hypothetical protein HXS40_13445 [Theionarchaea archaeon]|nr:hypothetical protein [Theionarchaea archaeon]